MSPSLQEGTESSSSEVKPAPDIGAGLAQEGSFTAIEHLVCLLQGRAEPSIADAGITAYPSMQLDNIRTAARQEADVCQERAELLLDLLESALESGCAPTMETQLRIARHLRLLGRDQRRWNDLADNAAYYRDNPRVAARIAGWRQQQGT